MRFKQGHKKILLIILLLVITGLLFYNWTRDEDPIIADLHEREALPITQEKSEDLQIQEVATSSNRSEETVVETKAEKVNATIPTMEETHFTTMAWIYPGEPACTALTEAGQRNVDILKPEYFLVTTGGKLEMMTEEVYGCNGYSSDNAQIVRSMSKEQYVTVSSPYAEDMRLFLQRDVATGEATRELIEFVTKEQFEGIEIDFEDYGGWDAETYSLYKNFLQELGGKLHRIDKRLMVDVPAVSNTDEEQWYVLRLAELQQLPIDTLVVMAYDYQYDHGAGEPVAPLDWIERVIAFTKLRFSDVDRISIGIPAYGYKGRGTNIEILTREQIQGMPGYDTAQRDRESGEMMWKTGKNTFVYQDEQSLSLKRDTVQNAGVSSVSVWHLGGNAWFQ